MKRIRTALAAVALVLAIAAPTVGVVVIDVANPEPAAAHNYDVLSYWYCSKHRSGPEQQVIHSWPYMLAPGVIGYWCLQAFLGGGWHQYWVHVAPPGSDNSWRPWPFQPCWVVICEGPAHQSA